MRTVYRISDSAAEGILNGKVIGIGGGELLLQTPEGIRKLVQADEVRVVD